MPVAVEIPGQEGRDAPGVLQLLGHPVRWGVLGELAHSDRTVRELVDLVGHPQNLVSYHLAKLRAAGVVTSRRSSADRRDAYHSADLARLGELLAAAGAALHPGLRVPSPGRAFEVDLVLDDGEATVSTPRRAHGSRSGPRPRPRARVLFLCTGNSARSQMAEALVAARAGGAVLARSAGSHPKPVHPTAIEVMREQYGLDISSAVSKPLDRFAEDRFDYVVTLCDRVREVCPEFPGAAHTIHWSLVDPSVGPGPDDATLARFESTAADLDTRIRFLLARLDEPNSIHPPQGERHDRNA